MSCIHRILVALALSLIAIPITACTSSSSAPPVVAVPADVGRVGPSAPIATMPSSSSSDARTRAGNDDAVEEDGSSLADKDAIGQRAPGFTAEAFDKQTAPARLLKRKVTVLHFFATWCGPCKTSLPKLEKLQTKHGSRDFQAIAVSVDDEKTGVVDYVKSVGATTLSIGWDSGHEIANRYKVGTMPMTFVIDHAGVIRAVYNGYHDGQDIEIERLLQTLL